MAKKVQKEDVCPGCGKVECVCASASGSCCAPSPSSCGPSMCDPNKKKYKGVVKLLMAVVLVLFAAGYLVDIKLVAWFFAVVFAAKGLVLLTKKC
ncbi:MAG: hypothetical protein Q7S22_01955 [Candidatus Micrarchaeota archaeon]|nr:hypothetical protein [Candidatus Micrarchaeota archaeon]